jgi:hypothetical protein
VDVANTLFAMAASVTRARALRDAGRPETAEAEALADVFCRRGRRHVRALFRDLWRNDDVARYRLGVDVVEGRHEWLEEGRLERSPQPSGEPEREAVGHSR